MLLYHHRDKNIYCFCEYMIGRERNSSNKRTARVKETASYCVISPPIYRVFKFFGYALCFVPIVLLYTCSTDVAPRNGNWC